jgi:hypothetical protein
MECPDSNVSIDKTSKNNKDASIIRYQTNRASFKLINFPNMPVAPAKIIDICSFINASFTMSLFYLIMDKCTKEI